MYKELTTGLQNYLFEAKDPSWLQGHFTFNIEVNEQTNQICFIVTTSFFNWEYSCRYIKSISRRNAKKFIQEVKEKLGLSKPRCVFSSIIYNEYNSYQMREGNLIFDITKEKLEQLHGLALIYKKIHE